MCVVGFVYVIACDEPFAKGRCTCHEINIDACMPICMYISIGVHDYMHIYTHAVTYMSSSDCEISSNSSKECNLCKPFQTAPIFIAHWTWTRLWHLLIVLGSDLLLWFGLTFGRAINRLHAFVTGDRWHLNLIKVLENKTK